MGWAEQISQSNVLNTVDIPVVIKETITSLGTVVFLVCMKSALTGGTQDKN